MYKFFKISTILLFIISLFLFLLNTQCFATSNDSAETNIEPTSSNVDDSDLPTDDYLSNSGVNNIQRMNTIPEANLGLNNILCIILIAIGVLLILFAIAILIRLKN